MLGWSRLLAQGCPQSQGEHTKGSLQQLSRHLPVERHMKLLTVLALSEGIVVDGLAALKDGSDCVKESLGVGFCLKTEMI